MNRSVDVKMSRRTNPLQALSYRIVSGPSAPSKAIGHLLLHILGAFFLYNRQCIVLEHAQSLSLPLGLSRLPRFAGIPATPATIIVAIVVIVSTPPVTIPVIVARVATRLAVEHVVVPVVVAVITASAIVARLVSAVVVAIAVAVIVVGILVSASAIGFVAFGLITIARTASIVLGPARRIVFVV